MKTWKLLKVIASNSPSYQSKDSKNYLLQIGEVGSSKQIRFAFSRKPITGEISGHGFDEAVKRFPEETREAINALERQI